MADLILALVIIVVGGCAAELVRMSFRRQLLTPVRAERQVSAAPAGRVAP
jgi:hypothetical protein